VPKAQRYKNLSNQQDTANQLWDRIFDGKPGHMTVADLDQFQDLDFLILVPPMMSLKNQSLDRLLEVFPEHLKEKFPDDEVYFKQYCRDHIKMVNCVAESNPAGKLAWEALAAEIIENPKRLLVFFHDESHWGIAKDGMVAKALLATKAAYQPNVLIIHISATPWNMSECVSQYKYNITRMVSPPTYKGRSSTRK
jgi:hypothetical protein